MSRRKVIGHCARRCGKVHPAVQHWCNFQQTQGPGFATIASAGMTAGGCKVTLTVLLVCAVIASLGVGVLLAYGICLALFRLFRIHATQVAARRVVPAAIALGVIGN